MMFAHAWVGDEAAHVLAILLNWIEPAQQSEKQGVFLAIANDKFDVLPAPSPSWDALTPAARVEAFRCLVALECFADTLTDAALNRLDALNKHASVHSPWPRIVRHARAGHSLRATIAMGRHAPDGKRMLRLVWQAEGPWGVLRVILGQLGVKLANARLISRYAGLAERPDGSLARAFCAHMNAHDLPLPGYPGSLPEQALQHDLMHVVSGFDTDARGESRLAGFYAGVAGKFPIAGADPFTFIMVALLTFQLGYRVGPGFVATERGAVDPRELWTCVESGLRAPRSPLGAWDFHAELSTPLAEVRARFGFPVDGVLLPVPA
jgi:hypothetical protein